MSSNCYYCGGHPDEVIDLRRLRDEQEDEISRLKRQNDILAGWLEERDAEISRLRDRLATVERETVMTRLR